MNRLFTYLSRSLTSSLSLSSHCSLHLTGKTYVFTEGRQTKAVKRVIERKGLTPPYISTFWTSTPHLSVASSRSVWNLKFNSTWKSLVNKSIEMCHLHTSGLEWCPWNWGSQRVCVLRVCSWGWSGRGGVWHLLHCWWTWWRPQGRGSETALWHRHLQSHCL